MGVNLVIEAGNTSNHCPKFQAKFHVAEEETGGPLQGFIQRYRQPLGHHVARFQYPGADGALQEGTPVN